MISFDQTAAAWVQAVGSVLAIIGAVWIDQGAARRLRKDRLDELEEARDARVGTVRYAVKALATIADDANAWDKEALENVGREIDGKAEQSLRAAATAVIHRLQRPGETDASTLCLLALADQCLTSVSRQIHGLQPCRSAQARDLLVKACRDGVQELNGLLGQHRAGTL